MTDSTPAEALNANHFHARGGRVWNDGLMDPDAYRRMIYQRWGIDPEEKFVALDPAMRERSINLLRDTARALLNPAGLGSLLEGVLNGDDPDLPEELTRVDDDPNGG